ncbi:ABC transporter permease [Tessaracoccus oleiagri]|uniref:Thiamine transport system permease protein n=1 Tax=Tessaracoccus oleiagri TaxID=686624 RepID=A0A1G9MXK5_9ACTN|nr:iron ABC transporter permease [Tessaracoccus oleiagri]SDL78657.1 thiamine transport system permease protein [Tessaracoccus oleiagri]
MIRRLAWVLVAAVPAAFLAVFFVWPALSLVTRGFHDGESWTLAGLAAVAGSRRTWDALVFTLATASAATAITVALGVVGAYVLYRLRFRGQSWLRGLVTVPFVLPTVVVGIAFSGPHPVAGIVLAMVFFNYSVVVRTVGALWIRLDPRQAQAATALGASPRQVALSVTLPSLGPAVASAAALVFLFCASGFGIVMTLGRGQYHTIETEIWFQTTQVLNLTAAAALSIAQVVVVTVSLWLTNAWQRRSQAALKLMPETSSTSAPVWGRDWPALLLTGVVILGLLVVPLAGLVLRSLRVRGAWSLDGYRRLLDEELVGAISTSLVTATGAAAIAVGLGMLVALTASRRPHSRTGRSWLHALETVYMLPLGVSAVTVGFGYLITLNRPPLDLRSSVVLIPIAQAVVALPLVVRTLLPTLRAISPRQIQAAQVLGASPLRVLGTIELPALGRGFGLALGFAFATSLGEFGATTFLARPDNPTLPVLIYRLFSRPTGDNYAMALAASVVLALLTAAVMVAAEQARPREVESW